ncbi:hypothetical protein V2J94_41455 [Streptomyces sp. DSM 41524]|uniref:Antitoxin VbhA domain-containing protein n=1 Tax=Streptomyces asiaticus subsp. ignotus TaxID=3098222 RepID=A0ABU7QB91_9ACTN|nr:hypothetical protein [Streptomyces sp. DSM 41524]
MTQDQKTAAVAEAAREVLAHGGPECRTDPKQVMRAMGRAYDLGATEDDVKAEMRRQRGA